MLGGLDVPRVNAQLIEVVRLWERFWRGTVLTFNVAAPRLVLATLLRSIQPQ